MQIELTKKELDKLMALLDDHLHYGWVEPEGEFKVAASGRVDDTLRELFWRLKRQAEAIDLVNQLTAEAQELGLGY